MSRDIWRDLVGNFEKYRLISENVIHIQLLRNSRPGQSAAILAGDNLKCIFLNENVFHSIFTEVCS